MRSLCRMAAGAVLVVAAACSGEDSDGAGCPVGSESCECTPGGGCNDGLECYSGLCVDPGGDSGDRGKLGGPGNAAGGDGGEDGGGGTAAPGGMDEPGNGNGSPADDSSDPTCLYPGSDATGLLYGSAEGPFVSLRFSDGVLSSLDDSQCAPISADTTIESVKRRDCWDAYDCGGCTVFITSWVHDEKELFELVTDCLEYDYGVYGLEESVFLD